MKGRPPGALLRDVLVAAGERDADAARPPARSRGEWLMGRPSLPPLLFVALSMWLGIVLGVEALFDAAAPFRLGVALAGAAGLSVGLPLLLRGHPLVGCLVVGLALGLVLGAAQAHSLALSQDALLHAPGPFVCEVERDSRASSYGVTATAHVVGGPRVLLQLPRKASLLVGDRVVIRGGFKAPAGQSARSRWEDGVAATATAGSVELADATSPLAPMRELRRAAVGMLQDAAVDGPVGRDEAAAFLGAVVLGHAAELYESPLYQTVKVDGIAHMVAVSGAHLVIVCGAVAAALRRAAVRRPLAIGLQLAVLCAYLVLTGMPVSALRAAAMSAAGLLSFFGGRRPYALGGLSACIIVLLAADPAAAFSTSFLLSAAATLGIVLFSGLFAELLGGALHMPAGIVRDAVALTFASSLITGPVSACLFAQVSLIAPVSNIVATLAFPAICIGGFCVILLAVAIPPAAGAVLGLAFVPLGGFIAALELLAGLPLAAVPVAVGPVAAVLLSIAVPAFLWLRWPRPRRRGIAWAAVAMATVVLAMGISPLMRGDSLTALDVGQGDAILVQSRGRALLVDTGTDDVALLKGLAQQGASHLDAVLVTHPDDDHCGSLPALQGVVGVDRVLVAADLLGEDDEGCAALRSQAARLVGADGVIGLHAGDEVTVGDVSLSVVGPDAFHDGGGNADSLVLLLSAGEGGPRALLCGDAEAQTIDAYLDAGRVGGVDILKVGHHGSRASLDDSILSRLRPEVALVSVGAGNRYGHPTDEALACLARAGSAVFRTDEDGAITCLLGAGGVTVRCER